MEHEAISWANKFPSCYSGYLLTPYLLITLVLHPSWYVLHLTTDKGLPIWRRVYNFPTHEICWWQTKTVGEIKHCAQSTTANWAPCAVYWNCRFSDHHVGKSHRAPNKTIAANRPNLRIRLQNMAIRFKNTLILQYSMTKQSRAKQRNL